MTRRCQERVHKLRLLLRAARRAWRSGMRFAVRSDDEKIQPEPIDGAARKPLPPAAQRALAEAAERRAQAKRDAHDRPPEFGGPKGLEPTRFGDWERKGIASDF